MGSGRGEVNKHNVPTKNRCLCGNIPFSCTSDASVRFYFESSAVILNSCENGEKCWDLN